MIVNTLSSGYEYGYEVKLSANGSNLFVNTPVRTDSQGGSFEPNFTWDYAAGLTVGASHGHPGGSAPSPADVDWLFGNLSQPHLANAGAYYINLYKEHAFVTAITQNATYTINVKDWNMLQYDLNMWKGFGMRGFYTATAQQYMMDNPLSTPTEASEAALLYMFGNSINVYKQNANSSVYIPLKMVGIGGSFNTVQNLNCP